MFPPNILEACLKQVNTLNMLKFYFHSIYAFSTKPLLFRRTQVSVLIEDFFKFEPKKKHF